MSEGRWQDVSGVEGRRAEVCLEGEGWVAWEERQSAAGAWRHRGGGGLAGVPAGGLPSGGTAMRFSSRYVARFTLMLQR